MIYERTETRRGGVVENRPVHGGGKKKDKIAETKPELQEGGIGIPIITPEEQKKATGPGAVIYCADKNDLPPGAVCVLKSSSFVNGQVIEQIVGAYTEEALNKFLASKGYTLGPKGVVFPLYAVQIVEVKR